MSGKIENNNACDKQVTITSLCELFLQIEKEEALLDFEIGNVRIWQHLRIQIYYRITEALSIFDKPHEFKAQNKKFVRLCSFIKNSIIANPFFDLSKVECIIFDHPRSKEVNGELIDICTNSLVNEHLNSNVDFVVIERAFDLDHKRERKEYISYIDFFILIGELKARLFKRKLSLEEKIKIEKIEAQILDRFGVVVFLSQWFEFEANKFYAINWLFLLYFKRKSPSCIYLAVSYALGYVIKAAKECGVKVVELQHGVISPYHMGYSYPDRIGNVEYFPDQFWTWGGYWNTCSFFPIPQDNIVARGNDYFNSQKKKYLHIDKVKNSILFISQGVLGERIVRFIDEVLPIIGRDYQITLKLHPGEFDRFNKYDKIGSILGHSNITIVKECDLFFLFSISEYQVGVFSTAIYEGLSFGCKTILLDMPGVEYMDRLLERKMVKLCDNPNSFTRVLGSFGDEETELIEGYGKTFFN